MNETSDNVIDDVNDEPLQNSGQKGKSEGNLLKCYLNTFRRKIFIISSFAILGTVSALLVSRQDPAIYPGKFEILVEPVTSQEKMTDASILTRNQGIPDETFLTLDYPTILRILKSSLLLNQIAEDLHKKYPSIPKNIFLQNLQKNLIVQRIQQGKSRFDYTKIIQVTYEGKNPQLVKSVLEITSENFLDYSIEERQKNLQSGIIFIDQQIPKLQERIAKLQTQQKEIQQQYGLINPQQKGETLLDDQLTTEREKIDIKNQLDQLSIILNNLEQSLEMSADEALVASTISQNPERQELLSSLQQIEQELALQSSQFTSMSPTVQNLIDKRLSLQKLLEQKTQEILLQNNVPFPVNSNVFLYQDNNRLELIQQLIDTKNQIDSLTSTYQSLIKNEQEINQKIAIIPEIIKQYNELERQLALDVSILNQLSLQRETLSVEAAQKKAPWQLITQPQLPLDEYGSPLKYPPDPKKKLIAGLGGGLMMGMLLSILLEKRRDVFYEVSDLEANFSQPILGIINRPDINSNSTDDQSFHSNTLTSEQHHSFVELYTNLYFTLSQASDSRYSLMISSIHSEDYQGYISSNLAKISSSLGQATLIIDANLSHPEVHHYFNVSNQKGVIDLINFQENPSDLLLSPFIDQSLFILPTGKLRNQDSFSLGADKLHSTFDQLSENSKLTIYNTSNFLDSYDLSLLANHLGGLVLIVCLKQTSMSSVKESIKRIKQYRLNLLGFIVVL